MAVADTVKKEYQWAMVHGGYKFMGLGEIEMKGPLLFMKATFGPDVPILVVVDYDLGVYGSLPGACSDFKLLSDRVRYSYDNEIKEYKYREIQADLRYFRGIKTP